MNDDEESGGGVDSREEHGIAPPGYRLPEAICIGPIRLQVSDLERSVDFYRHVLGLEALSGSAGLAWLGVPGGDEPLVELVERPGARPVPRRGRLGLYHFALLLPDRRELARFAVHLREIGSRFGMGDHGVSEALYLTDPDGLGIEVYADRPRGSWQWSGRQLVMTTEPLDLADLVAQADGTPFDSIPTGTVVGHIHLHVGDLQEAARFYHEALGFDKVVWSYPGALFLSAGGYHHHVGTNTWAAGAPAAGPDDARLLSWRLVLPAPPDVERAAVNLESKGYRVVSANGARRVADPWGTVVELVASRTRDG